MKKTSFLILLIISFNVFAWCSLGDQECNNQEKMLQLQEEQLKAIQDQTEQMRRAENQRQVDSYWHR